MIKKYLLLLIALCLLLPLCASAGEVLRVVGCDEWMPGADNERILLADTAVEAAFPGLAVIRQTATREELDIFSGRGIPDGADIFLARAVDWPHRDAPYLDVTALYREAGFGPFGSLTGRGDKHCGVPFKIYCAMAVIKDADALREIGLSMPFTWEELFSTVPAFMNWSFKQNSPVKLVRDTPFSPAFLWQATRDAENDPKAENNFRMLAAGWKDLYDRGLIATGNEPALIEIAYLGVGEVNENCFPLPAVAKGGVTSVLSAQTCVGNTSSKHPEAVKLWLKTLLTADAGYSGLPDSEFKTDTARENWLAALKEGCARDLMPAFLRTWKNIMTGMLAPDILGGN